MRRVLVPLAVLVALLPLGTRPSWAACRCVGPETPAGDVERAALVFTGRVVAIDTPISDTAVVGFRVETLYKGSATRMTTVTTPLSGALCHFDFRPGVRYTVFADDHGSTTACSGNVRGVINAGGYGVAPIPLSKGPPSSGTPPWLWIALGVSLAVALALALTVGRSVRRSAATRSGLRPARRAPAP